MNNKNESKITKINTVKRMIFMGSKLPNKPKLTQCTKVRFSNFFSGGFTTMAVMNPLEKKLEKRTSVHWWNRLCETY